MINTTKIYLITNCYNNPNKVYIGKSTRPDIRKREHKMTFGSLIEFNCIDEVNSIKHKDWKPIETYWIQQFMAWGFEIMNIRKEGGSGPIFQNKEAKLKIGASQKGKILSKEHLEKLKKVNTGIKRTPEQIKKLSEAHKGIKRPDTTLRLSKPILQYDLDGNFIKEWPSIREVSKFLNISHCVVQYQLNGKTNSKLLNHSIWKYKN